MKSTRGRLVQVEEVIIKSDRGRLVQVGGGI